MAKITKNLGTVSAYGYAKAKGYTGTEEEFAELMNSITDAHEISQDAEASATEAESYAKGGTSSRTGEDTDNALYYAGQAATSATGASTNALKSEGHAVGQQNGTDVESGSAYYHNNAKYYAEQASGSATSASTSAGSASDCAEDSEAYAIGKRSGTDVGSTDPTYHNNAKYYAERAEAADEDITERIATAVPTAVDAWLDENITNPDSPPLDRSLSSSSAAAPADLVGDLKSDLNKFEVVWNLPSWESGTFNSTDGSNYTSTSYVRNQTKVGVPTGVSRITCSSGHLFLLFAYNSTGTYVGSLKQGNIFDKTGSNYLMSSDFDCTNFPTYTFKIGLRLDPSSTSITPAAGAECFLYSITDKTLTEANKAADAKAVGDAIKEQIVTSVFSSGWVNQGYTGSSNAKRLSLFLSQYEAKKWGKVAAPSGYSISLSGNKYYVWTGSAWATSNLAWFSELDLSAINLQYSTIGFTLRSDDNADVASTVGSNVIFYQKKISFSDIENSLLPYLSVDKVFYGANNTLDCNSAELNTIKIFNSSTTITNGPDNFNDWTDGGNWELRTYGPAVNSAVAGGTYVFQFIDKLNGDIKKRIAQRIKSGSTWESWNIVSGLPSTAIHIGSGYTYTRLRDGIAAAVAVGDMTVYVHPGTYNLINEFASEIEAATGTVGIALGNNIHVIFYDGAKVTANFDNSESTYDSTTWRWIYTSFQPFYAGSGNFILENLEIEATDTRYCVHDEKQGSGTYKHEYINCRMKYTNTHSDISYVQCIGGGLGEHGTIIIDGGYYKTVTEYGYDSVGGDAENSQQPISFHNGSAASCDSSIYIKNVYLADRGYFRFGWYGSSTIKSQVQINGCSVGLATLVKAEGTASVRNFELTEFGIDKRNAYHWELSLNGQTASLVADT